MSELQPDVHSTADQAARLYAFLQARVLQGNTDGELDRYHHDSCEIHPPPGSYVGGDCTCDGPAIMHSQIDALDDLTSFLHALAADGARDPWLEGKLLEGLEKLAAPFRARHDYPEA